MSKRNAVIALKNVGFSYGGVRQALREISFEILEGERVVILGHNGSGKSTLVKILGALQIPSQGACFVCGYNTAWPDGVSALRKRVGLVFQDPESQIVASAVEDDAAFAPENQGLAPQEIERRVTWALEKAGLLHKRGVLSSALSGGEKQRLVLAGALAAIGGHPDSEGPSCLILDEPTSMLDPEGRADVENILRDLHAAGVTIVQTTHRLEDTLHADRVLILSQGRLTWQGPPSDVPPRPVPYTCIRPPEGLMGSRGASLKGHAPWGEVVGLWYSFNRSTPFENQVLKGVSCLLPRGWVSILGRTGSGKSTFIQHLNGLYAIQSGEIKIVTQGGQERVPLPRKGPELRNLRRRVGLVFQSPEDQLFAATVREELAFAPRNWGFSEEAVSKSVTRALENVGLDESYLERNPLRLSGGERRLVAIASVLAAEPECIVLDEPTAGLDEWHRERILQLISRMKNEGKTVIAVTHDFEMALGCSDFVLVMDGGRKVYEGGARESLVALRELGFGAL